MQKEVVLCKDCIHRPLRKSAYGSYQPPLVNGYYDEKCPFICSQWKYTKMPKDDDFCSRGEKDEQP